MGKKHRYLFYYTHSSFNFDSLEFVTQVLCIIEPRHEKTNNLHMRKQRRRSASRLHREADQRLCFRYSDSTILLLFKSEISSLLPSSVIVQLGLCQTHSKTTLLVFLCLCSVIEFILHFLFPWNLLVTYESFKVTFHNV